MKQGHNSSISQGQVAGNAALLLASLIWGSAFIAQTLGMRSMQPYTFQMMRSAIGAIVLLPVIYLLDRRESRSFVTGWQSPILWKAGIRVGGWVFIAAGLQQVGLLTTTAGKSGFITALYMILIPLVGLFFGKRLHMIQTAAVVLALVGLGLLCLRGDLHFVSGDIYTLLCAFFFTAQILTIDKYCQLVDVVRLSAIQFLICGLLSAVAAFGFETVTLTGIYGGWGSLLYTGVLSTGVAYTLQIVGQKQTSATLAAIIMSLEAVFAAICGWIFLGQAMSRRELLGALFMFAAVLLAQWPVSYKSACNEERSVYN
ncbi:MAG: DMT family transporter [Lachnospiraceae bacterium]|nr:DMT family transporter [Lachnospiraceae bacterium]MDY5741461.1 DMT family transporter [Lachnospiraceae bacterium]